MKELLFIIVGLLISLQMQAQTEPKPEWFGKTEHHQDANFYYISGVGDGLNKQEAKAAAWVDALFNAHHASGLVAIQGYLKTRLSGDKVQTRKDIEMELAPNVIERPLACETREIMLPNGKVRVYVLLQVQKDGSLPANVETYAGCTAEFDAKVVKWNKVMDGEYPPSPHAFIPGWRQFDKGSKTKAWIFIGGEAVLLGGAALYQTIYSSNHSKSINPLYDGNWPVYAHNAVKAKDIRNGCLIGAGVLYLVNVIDGLAARGEKGGGLRGNNNFKISPYADLESGGMALTFNF
jgi:hypothetical protein